MKTMHSRILTTGLMSLKVLPLFILLLCVFSTTPFAETVAIAPDRTITVVADKPDVPEWKNIWDKARENVRLNNYALAAKLYADLFVLKPNIEEANWEYCKVLLETENFSPAVNVIVSLLEKDPLNLEYLMAAGKVAIQQNQFERAIKYFGKVYELDPVGIQSAVALDGLIKSLKGLGRRQIAFPLLEQLQLREPDNVSLLHELALDATAFGKIAKAKAYFIKLLSMGGNDDRVLFQAAELFESSGAANEAVPLWIKYSKSNPNYLPFQQKLADFYLGQKDFKAALPYLLILADKTPNNDSLLVEIANIYLLNIGRPDKALVYYERSLKKNPQNRLVQKKITNIQSILANDFLSIVENDGAWLLWRDLAKLTPNRQAIYLEMATILEKKGKLDELLEILLIVHDHAPNNDNVTYRIAELYRKKNDYGQALTYLEDITQNTQNTQKNSSAKRHLIFKGNMEDLVGLEQEALTSYIKALKKDISDLNLRQICITKAGALGMVPEVENLFKNNQIDSYNREHLGFVLNYLEQLAYNSLFTRLDSVYNRFLVIYKKDPEAIFKLQFQRASTLRLQGKIRKAEELLRKLLNVERFNSEVLFQLTLNAAEDRSIEAAGAWYRAFVQTLKVPFSAGQSVYFSKKMVLEINILLAENEATEAARKIEDMKKNLGRGKDDVLFGPLIYQLERKLCWLYLENGMYLQAKLLLTKFQNSNKFDPEILVILGILERQLGPGSVNISTKYTLDIGKQPIASRYLMIAQTELQQREYDLATQHVGVVLNRVPGSVAARMLMAEVLLAKGEITKAVAAYKLLSERFPKEKYFQRKWIAGEVRQGNYANGLSILSRGDKNLLATDSLLSQADQFFEFDEIVLLARLLWGDKQFEKSLSVYKLLLEPPVIELLEKRFELDKIYYLFLNREESFWNSLLFLLQTKPEIVAELMAPPFLVDNLGNETGKIVAEYFSLYSWQKLILNEYLARKAIVQRNYVVAERKYKQLFSEEESAETLYDLASIYDRFGQYRKEAQLYEAIKDSGVTSPELKSSIEKSSLKIRPHTSFDLSLLRKTGRDGYIDLGNKAAGGSMFFTPDLEKDIKFQFFRNHYDNTSSDESISSSMFESSGTIELFTDTDFLFSLAAERLTGMDATNFYYSLGIRRRLDNFFSGYAEAYKKKVDDTLGAIIEGIYSDGFEIGLTGETPIGLRFGGDYRHRYYSDGNSQDRFHGWSAFSLYKESAQYALQYDFQYLENSDSNVTGISQVIDAGSNEKLYWKPGRFSEHKLTLHFQHLIKGTYGSDGLLSFFSFDNSVGYEDTENVSYTGEFDIFLEMSPHYLLKGNFVFERSDEYEEKSILLSLFYRW